MNAKINCIVFDLGGVLINWDPRRLYRKIFDTEEEVDTFLQQICKSNWNVEQDAGRSLKLATDELLERHPEWENEIRAYYGRWEEMLVGPIVDTVNLLEDLDAAGAYNLYALTNWSAETFPIAVKKYDFLKIFKGILVSGEEKLIKPDPRIYQLLFSRYKIEAQRAVFIDDSLKNVEAARKLGMQSIHFQSSAQLDLELKEVLRS